MTEEIKPMDDKPDKPQESPNQAQHEGNTSPTTSTTHTPKSDTTISNKTSDKPSDKPSDETSKDVASDKNVAEDGINLPQDVPSSSSAPKVVRVGLTQEESERYNGKTKRIYTPKKGALHVAMQQLKTPQGKVGAFLGVSTLLIASMFMFKGEEQRRLKGDESIQSEAQGEMIYNEQQAEFALKRALEEQGEGQAGLNINTATRRVIRPSEFDAKDIQDTNRFKPVIDPKSNTTVFIDVMTNKRYDVEGNEVVDIPIEQPQYNPVPVSYSQFNQHANYVNGQYNNTAQNASDIAVGTANYQPTTTQTEQEQAEQTYTNPQGQQVTLTHSPQLQSRIESLNNQNTTHTQNVLDVRSQTQQIHQNFLQEINTPRPANPNVATAQTAINNTLSRLNQPSSYGIFNYDVVYQQGSLGEYKQQLASGQATSNLGTGAPTPYSQGAYTPNATNNPQSPKLLPATTLRQGTSWLVMITQDVNSDKSNTVQGMILDGYYKGATIRGRIIQIGSRNQNITVQFDTIEPKNPRQPIVVLNAEAMNLKDNSPAVATDIDRHYVQNYSAIVLESVAQGYGEAYSNVGETTVVTDSGNVITTKSNKPDTATIRGEVIGALSDRLNQDIVRFGNRPITFKIAKGTVVKVRLLNNLDTLTGTSTNTAMAGRSTQSSSAPQQASQQTAPTTISFDSTQK